MALLSESRRRVLRLIAEGFLTPKEMAQADPGVSWKGLYTTLDRMLGQGLVERRRMEGRENTPWEYRCTERGRYALAASEPEPDMGAFG